jgi:hypothetical protein
MLSKPNPIMSSTVLSKERLAEAISRHSPLVNHGA